MSIVRRRPGHAFLWPNRSYKDYRSARSLWGNETVSDKETRGMATADLSETFFIGSNNFSTLRNMMRHCSIIESVAVVVVVVVLHMPGLARWLTPRRSSCGSTLFIITFFIIHLLCSSSASSFFFFLCFFLLLLPASSSWGKLPFFFAGEVGCLLGQER